jgi:hypothetical protein
MNRNNDNYGSSRIIYTRAIEHSRRVVEAPDFGPAACIDFAERLHPRQNLHYFFFHIFSGRLTNIGMVVPSLSNHAPPCRIHDTLSKEPLRFSIANSPKGHHFMVHGGKEHERTGISSTLPTLDRSEHDLR